MLKGEDVTNASVDGIAKPSQGLVRKCCDGFRSPVGWNHQEELRGVAGPKNLVHRREMSRPFLCVKVGSEDAFRHAFTPEKLACAARTSTASGASAHIFQKYVMLCWDRDKVKKCRRRPIIYSKILPKKKKKYIYKYIHTHIFKEREIESDRLVYELVFS